MWIGMVELEIRKLLKEINMVKVQRREGTGIGDQKNGDRHREDISTIIIKRDRNRDGCRERSQGEDRKVKEAQELGGGRGNILSFVFPTRFLFVVRLGFLLVFSKV
jgi:hypothetical protein